MTFDERIIIFDDFIEKEYQEKIKEKLLGKPDQQIFPWFYVEDVTAAYDPDSQHRPGLAHPYVDLPEELTGDEDDGLEPNKVGKVLSKYHNLFVPMLQRVGFKLGLSDIKVLQGRSFLQFPLNTDGTIDSAHIDIYCNFDFIVALYYVCDSDGDTVIYNETEESETYTIKKSVTPKQGRMVIFDGKLYHAARQPINSNTRCIVNYNLRI
tara:strand:+ start:49 stop:675 length:627 start_codon:yes stop_codon:yes gene_type:complete